MARRFGRAPAALPTSLYLAAIGIGGYFLGREAVEELIFGRKIGIELQMSVAAVVAAAMGQLGEEMCGDVSGRWEEALAGARSALEARLALWDGMLTVIRPDAQRGRV